MANIKEALDYEIDGLQVVEARPGTSLRFRVTREDLKNGRPRDYGRCAIALSCKRSLLSPLVRIQRKVAYVALPHPDGRPIPGHKGKYVYEKYRPDAASTKVIIAVDIGQTKGMDDQMVNLIAIKPSDIATAKKRRMVPFSHKKTHGRTRVNPKRGRDVLTLSGVRNFAGIAGYKRGYDK